MARTQIYVDPSIAADSGTGTVGDPFGDLEYAIEQTTFDTTNGTQVNIKSGTAEVLAATIDTAMADTVTTAAWVPTATAPAVFRGYTATANDGGIGVIDGNATTPIFNSATLDYVHLQDLVLQNVGANPICTLDRYIVTTNVKVDSGQSGIAVGLWGQIRGVTATNLTGSGIKTGDRSIISHCHVDEPGGAYGISLEGDGVVEFNIVKVTGAVDGIRYRDRTHVRHNSIFSSGGTGQGIISDGNSRTLASIENNLVEGFSGTGGVGIHSSSTGVVLSSMQGNAVYNCATAYSNGEVFYTSDNETLSASPFTDATNDDFSPVDTGNVKEGALPQVFGDGSI